MTPDTSFAEAHRQTYGYPACPICTTRLTPGTLAEHLADHMKVYR